MTDEQLKAQVIFVEDLSLTLSLFALLSILYVYALYIACVLSCDVM